MSTGSRWSIATPTSWHNQLGDLQHGTLSSRWHQAFGEVYNLLGVKQRDYLHTFLPNSTLLIRLVDLDTMVCAIARLELPNWQCDRHIPRIRACAMLYFEYPHWAHNVDCYPYNWVSHGSIMNPNTQPRAG